MKSTLLIGSLLAASFTCTTLSAQPNPERFARDQAVAKTILNQFFQSSNPDKERMETRLTTTQIEYVEGYGVVIHTPVYQSKRRGWRYTTQAGEPSFLQGFLNEDIVLDIDLNAPEVVIETTEDASGTDTTRRRSQYQNRQLRGRTADAQTERALEQAERTAQRAAIMAEQAALHAEIIAQKAFVEAERALIEAQRSLEHNSRKRTHPNAAQEMEQARKEMEAARKEMELARKEMEQVNRQQNRAARQQMTQSTRVNGQAQVETTSTQLKPDTLPADALVQIMSNYLAQYGDQIGGLDSSDRILLLYNEAGGQQGAWRAAMATGTRMNEWQNVAGQPKKIAVQTTVADLQRLRRGELTPEAFRSGLSVTDLSAGTAPDTEYRILAEVFGSLLGDITEKAKQNQQNNGKGRTQNVVVLGGRKNSVRYDRLPGMGVLYTLEPAFPSTVYIVDGRVAKPETEQLYQLLLTEVKRGMADYGRTLRTLPAGEQLIVRIDIPGCETCELPGEVQLTLSQEMLSRYDRGQATPEEVESAIALKEKGKAKDKKAGNVIIKTRGSSYEFWTQDEEE